MNKTYKVRLLIETSRGYGRALLRGIHRYSSLEGRWQTEQQMPFYLGSDRVLETRLGRSAFDADGVIMRDRKGSLDLLKKGIPVIFIGCLHETAPGICKIATDDQAIARLAAAHLLERGFRHFAFVGYDGLPWSKCGGTVSCKRFTVAATSALRSCRFEAALGARGRRSRNSLPSGSALCQSRRVYGPATMTAPAK